MVDVVDSNLGKDPDYFVDQDNIGVYKLNVVLFVFIVPITEFGSRDGVSKVHEELDYKRIVQSVIVTLNAVLEFADKVCY